MERRWVAVVLVGLLFLSTPAKASKLEGFGPIKFGMTMEEAFVAIEGKGRLNSETDTLTYKRTLGRDGREVDVSQSFTNGLASRATVRFTDEPLDRELCTLVAGRHAASIRDKYEVEPVIQQELTLEGGARITSLVFTFGFENSAALQFQVIFRPKSQVCIFEAHYFPPLQDVIPF